MNTSVDFVNTSATTVAADAVITQVAADTAAAASNFKGRWSDFGNVAATVPSSYTHNNADWQLLQDIPNISADEPVVHMIAANRLTALLMVVDMFHKQQPIQRTSQALTMVQTGLQNTG